MYTMEEIKSWWEVPAIAHFFSLFKSCFMLTDFTIEELEEALLTDGEDDRSTTFTSTLLTELLQGCYDNPNISVTSYHDALIDIMKKRWEEEDGRVNPLSSINADFHSLPTRLKVQIIHRLTEYRLDAKDVANKLEGLNPCDLRLEPLGVDRRGAKYWYFFGVRLYKETPQEKLPKKRKHQNRAKKKGNKRAKITNGQTVLESSRVLETPTGDEDSNRNLSIFEFFNNFRGRRRKRLKKKKKRKKQKDESAAGFRVGSLSESKWEVACYNIDDWRTLAASLDRAVSCEESLRLLVVENFLPNLPKIVEDMEHQKLQKMQLELPRRSSCRLLAKKLYEEEDVESAGRRGEKIKQERKAQEERRRQDQDVRLTADFEVMLCYELDRKRKEDYAKFKKRAEEHRRKRIVDGLPLYSEEESSSDGSPAPGDDGSRANSHLRRPPDGAKRAARDQTKSRDSSGKMASDPDVPMAAAKSKGRRPSNAKKAGRHKQQSAENRRSAASTTSAKKIAESADDGLEEVVRRTTGDVEYDAMMETWSLLDNHPEAWPFQKPVEEWYAPGYHDIIKRPMDLSSIEVKLNDRKYHKVAEFRDDITLMFNNCRLYNGPDSEYTEVADQLDALFRSSLIASLGNRKKAGGKKAADRKRSQSGSKSDTKTPPKNKKKAAAGVGESIDLDDDDENDEDEASSSSSDEFTPPGMSKAQVKKQRLEVAKSLGAITDKPGGRGRKTASVRGKRTSMGRGQNRTTSSDRTRKSESDSEEENAPAKPEKRRGPAARGRGRGTGRVVPRGRRASALLRNGANKSDDSEQDKTKRQPPSRRIRGGRRRGRGGRPPAQARVNNAVAKSSSSSSSEVDADSASGDDATQAAQNVSSATAEENTDGLSTDTEKGEGAAASPPANAAVGAVRAEQKTQEEESPGRDGDSSSSSSRASSPSPSREKFEKMQEDAKSKPQVVWSLDYLASQARVLEEQDRKHEASSSSNKADSLRRQSSDIARRDSTSDAPTASDSSRATSLHSSKPHPTTAVEQRRREPPSSNRPSETVAKQHVGGSPAQSKAPLSRTASQRGEEPDPYSFRDDESPLRPIADRTPEKATAPVPSRTIPSDPSPRSRSEKQVSPLATPQRKTPFHPTQPAGQRPHSASAVSLSPSAPKQAPTATPPAPPAPAEKEIADRNPRASSPQRRPAGIPPPLPTRRNSQSEPSSKPPVTSPGLYRNAPAPVATKPATLLQFDSTRVTSANPAVSKPPLTTSATAAAPAKSPGASPSNPPAIRPPSTSPAGVPPPTKPPPNVANPPFSQRSAAPSPYGQPSKPPAPADGTTRRNSQSSATHPPSASLKSPLYQPPPGPAIATSRSGTNDSLHGLPASRPEKPSHNPKPAAPVNQGQTGHENSHHQSQNRPRTYPQSASKPSHHAEHQRKPQAPSGPNYEHRTTTNRPSDSAYRATGSGPQQIPQASYSYGAPPGSTSGSRRNSQTPVSSREKPSYSHESSRSTTSTPLVSQHPNLASFGISPWALQQTQANEQPTHSPTDARHGSQRKQVSTSAGGGSGYANGKLMQGQNMQSPQPQQPPPRRQSAQHHPVMSTGNSHPPNPQHQGNQPAPAAAKHRNSASDPASATKHRSNSSSGGTQSARRQSNSASVHQYTKSHAADYMSYHIHPTAATTPLGVRDSRTPVYSPHQQNGLLGAAGANNNAALLHQDLHASATLRALQQQHKPDRSSHAAANMFQQYAAATQGAVVAAAASEQYNRLAASAAHHRATPQHPLAGVYHHHQNVATTSPHQAAAHLSSPWLQAAAAAPAAGYPSNLLAASHMDPAMYHLMQQSGMHGQYPMYPNSVMQQLHQQHLQHHMLPKY